MLSSVIFWDGDLFVKLLFPSLWGIPLLGGRCLKRCSTNWPLGHRRRCHTYRRPNGERVKAKQQQIDRAARGLFGEGLSKGTNTKVKDLTPSFSCLFVYPQLSCFPPLAAILALIRAPPLPISLTSLTFALWHKDPYSSVLNTNTPTYLSARSKRPQTLPALCPPELNWAAKFSWAG